MQNVVQTQHKTMDAVFALSFWDFNEFGTEAKLKIKIHHPITHYSHSYRSAFFGCCLIVLWQRRCFVICLEISSNKLHIVMIVVNVLCADDDDDE